MRLIIVLLLLSNLSYGQITKERSQEGVTLSAPKRFANPDTYHTWYEYQWEYTWTRPDGRIGVGMARTGHRYPSDKSGPLKLTVDPYKVKVTYYIVTDSSKMPIYTIEAEYIGITKVEELTCKLFYPTPTVGTGSPIN